MKGRSRTRILFEDAHSTDPTSLEVFGRVVNRTQTLRVMLIMTFRPEFAPGNEVVARGRIWISAGVVRHSHEFMPQQSYIVCDQCQRVDIRLKYAEHPKECEQCGSRLKVGARRP